MAYTFFKAQGKEVGKSKIEEDKLELAASLIKEVASRNVKLLLPLDVIVAPQMQPGVKVEKVSAEDIPSDMMGLDIGPQTIELYHQEISQAKTIFWNGPMGVFEIEEFATGTDAMARAIAGSSAISVVGGGDSVAALRRMGYTDKITHISTGGGASLEFLEGKVLPGVKVLREKIRI